MERIRIAIASPTSRALDRDRQRHLVAALDGRRDHRPPAAGRGVRDDVAAVADGAEHLGRRADDAVAEPIDVDGLSRLAGRDGHGAPPRCRPADASADGDPGQPARRNEQRGATPRLHDAAGRHRRCFARERWNRDGGGRPAALLVGHVDADDYVAYHDTEWGFPVIDDRRLFEKLCLEGFQSGLSWLTILRKREAFRRGVRRVRRRPRGRVRRRRRHAAARRRRDRPPRRQDPLHHQQRALRARRRRRVGLARRLRLVVRAGRRAPRRGRDDRVAAGQHDVARVGRDGEGPEEARLLVRRADHGLRVHAGDGPGQRPPRRLLRPGAGRGRARRAQPPRQEPA